MYSNNVLNIVQQCRIYIEAVLNLLLIGLLRIYICTILNYVINKWHLFIIIVIRYVTVTITIIILTLSVFFVGSGCSIEENIAHGKINVISQGAKLEVECDVGYRIVGPSFIYCNEYLEWNDVLRGCEG